MKYDYDNDICPCDVWYTCEMHRPCPCWCDTCDECHGDCGNKDGLDCE